MWYNSDIANQLNFGAKMNRSICNCIAVGLVCVCLGQGVKAPPSNAISIILVSGFSAPTSSTASAVIVGPVISVNMVTGKISDGVRTQTVLNKQRSNWRD
jgi:hypothetical protein